ncbi:MAG: MucB/RseB C-terminal domain-containing protein [Methylophilaceae bacterium]
MFKCFLSLLLLLPTLGNAADDPWLMIEKAAQAAYQLNYKGVFVYQVGSSTNAIEITHSNYGAGGEFTRLTVLEGAPREILRQGDDSVIYKTKSQKVLIEKRRIQSGFPAVLPKVTDGIKANYQVQTSATERVSGREASVLTLVPRDKTRYSSKLWIDKSSGLLLKLASLNDKNEVVEQVGFNQLVLFNNDNMDWFRPNEESNSNKTYVVQPEEEVTPAAETESWTVTQLPQGFHKIQHLRRSLPGKNMVTHLVFCDGLTTVSVFLEPMKNATQKQGVMTQGATSMYVTNVGSHQVVVLGEVPPAIAVQFANAIKFK